MFTWQFQETGGAALLIFQGIATGSLLYVVFFEILEKERVKDVNGFAQAVSMCFGYTLLVLLTMLEPQVAQIKYYKIFDALIEYSVKDSGVDTTTVSPTTPVAFNNSMMSPT